MTARTRPYLFYDIAISICSQCYAKVEGKIVFQDSNVYLLKKCQFLWWKSTTIATLLARSVTRTADLRGCNTALSRT